MAKLLEKIWDLRAQMCPRGARAHIWAQIFDFLKSSQNHANRGSTCRSQCPEHGTIFLFEIGLNLTELWAKAGCPSGRPRANFGGFWAITWPNFNIFAWDLFYMITTPELHHIAKL